MILGLMNLSEIDVSFILQLYSLEQERSHHAQDVTNVKDRGRKILTEND